VKKGGARGKDIRKKEKTVSFISVFSISQASPYDTESAAG